MHHDVTFNFGSAKVCAPVILETCISYDKDRIAATDYMYYVYFSIVVLFPLTSILQLINFTVS